MELVRISKYHSNHHYGTANPQSHHVTITYDVDRESFQRILQPMVEENYDKYADSIDLINSCAEAA